MPFSKFIDVKQLTGTAWSHLLKLIAQWLRLLWSDFEVDAASQRAGHRDQSNAEGMRMDLWQIIVMSQRKLNLE